MATQFWQYSYLQILDFLTTVAFLLLGIKEGNPVVRIAMEYSPQPWMGLAAVKAAALIIGVYCLKVGRGKLLFKMNVLFALVVAWNLVALIVAASHMRMAM